jgi:hypothetical protein
MEIPESISKLTTEVTPDTFIAKPQASPSSFNDIINIVKQRLDFVDYKYFEEGLASYKHNVNQDKNFIKNLLSIYSTAITRAIQESVIADEVKSSMIKSYKNTTEGLITNIEAIHELAITLNKNENIIDVQRISYIILGYVIDTIKKLNETRNRS